MHKHSIRPDLRHLARLTIGLGPGFHIGQNCDIAIETKPGETGKLVERGATLAADGKSRVLGGVGRERFVYSEEGGRWHTSLEVGMRVFKAFPLGCVGAQRVLSPMDGILRAGPASTTAARSSLMRH